MQCVVIAMNTRPLRKQDARYNEQDKTYATQLQVYYLANANTITCERKHELLRNATLVPLRRVATASLTRHG